MKVYVHSRAGRDRGRSGHFAIFGRGVRRGVLIAAILLVFGLISGCVEPIGPSFIPLPDSSSVPLDGKTHAYRHTTANPYRDTVAECALKYYNERKYCSLSKLPFIGMDTANPTIDDLLNRVVVTHRWMGERFEQVLRYMDEEMLKITLLLSRSITAITIGNNIRPSFYTSGASMIFLDPLRIALTEEENSVINQAPDYRSGFGDSFQFTGAWRYVSEQGEYLYNLTLGERTLGDVHNYLARLLFHEFAHANDFFPHHIVTNLSCRANIGTCANPPLGLLAEANLLSLKFGYPREGHCELRTRNEVPTVTGDYHLASTNLNTYACVRYGGRTIPDAAKTWQAADMGGWFEADVANHSYSYLTRYEDVAMLTEAVLIKYLLNGDMDVGYIAAPRQELVVAESPVTWGTRGRIGNANVKRRAHHLMDTMLPDVIPDSFFDNLDAERPMEAGCDWIDNLDLDCDESGIDSELRASRYDTHDYDHIEFDFVDPHHH